MGRTKKPPDIAAGDNSRREVRMRQGYYDLMTQMAMFEKWFRVLLQLTIGVLFFCYGLSAMTVTFSWLAWAGSVLGCSIAYFAVENAVCLMDKYERWKV